MTLKIETLNKSHDRKAFKCGELNLDNYLQKIARQHIDKGIAKTFVLIDSKKTKTIIAYMTLSACEVHSRDIPHDWTNKYPNIIPAIKLGRLAVDSNHQKQGHGELLMVDAMHKAINVSNNLGIVGLFVDAKHQKAKDYYQQYGFISMPDQLDNLFLPIKTIADLI